MIKAVMGSAPSQPARDSYLRRSERDDLLRLMRLQHAVDTYVLDAEEAFRVAVVEYENDEFDVSLRARIEGMPDRPNVLVLLNYTDDEFIRSLRPHTYRVHEDMRVAVLCFVMSDIDYMDVYADTCLEVVFKNGTLASSSLLVGAIKSEQNVGTLNRYLVSDKPRHVRDVYACGYLLTNRLDPVYDAWAARVLEEESGLLLPIVVPDCGSRRPFNRRRAYGMSTRSGRTVHDLQVLAYSTRYREPAYMDQRSIAVGLDHTLVMSRTVFTAKNRSVPLCVGCHFPVFTGTREPPLLNAYIEWVSHVSSFASDREMFGETSLGLIDVNTQKANNTGRLAMRIRNAGKTGRPTQHYLHQEEG